jgi:hypothetical protein
MVSACDASSCNTVNLSGGTLYFPGAVQWDSVRSTWVLFDQLCGGTFAACSYPVSASGALGTATTYLNSEGGSVCDMVQAALAAHGFGMTVGSDYEFCGISSSSDRWAYTAGGNPTNYATTSSPYSVLDGAAVSTK